MYICKYASFIHIHVPNINSEISFERLRRSIDMRFKCETYIEMYPTYTYMFRILIARYCLSVYAVQLVCALNVNSLPAILFWALWGSGVDRSTGATLHC